MTSTPSLVVARALLQAVVDQLPQDGRVGRSCVVPGAEVAWDDCCDGQLAVLLPNAYLSDDFPGQPGGGAATCAAPYLVQVLHVQIMRCTPTVDDRGLAPYCAALEANAEVVLFDAQAVRRGVIASLQALADAMTIIDWRVQDQPAIGPEGGCVGTELRVLVGFPNPGCG